MSVAENIRTRMEEKGIKQADICELLGCSQPFVSAIVNGEKIPSLFAAKKIANHLGCTVDELLQ